MIYIILIPIIIIILIYNNLIRLKNRVKNAYSNIDNQLKRRNDLIPNLVEVVKGYKDYESETLERIIQARNNLTNTKDISNMAAASDELSNSLTKLFALKEAYPDLKANKVFENLQVELSGTEDKIAYARQFYNNAVFSFNTKIEQFPNNALNAVLKFKKYDFFEATEKEKELVKVVIN